MVVKDIKERILKVEEYQGVENNSFGSLNYYVGNPNSKTDHCRGGGSLMSALKSLRKHLSQVERIEFGEDINQQDQILLKVLIYEF